MVIRLSEPRATKYGRADKPDQFNSHLSHLCACACARACARARACVCVCVCESVYVRVSRVCILQVRERTILSRKEQRIANIRGWGAWGGRQTVSSSLPP